MITNAVTRKSWLKRTAVMIGILLVSISAAAEIPEFERMWPTLAQPWNYVQPAGMATDSLGRIYVADSDNNRIQVFDEYGTFLRQWGRAGTEAGEFNSPAGIAIDSKDQVYVTDPRNHRIQVFDVNGNAIFEWGEFGEADEQFKFPLGIAIGSEDRIYVVDSGNNRIQVFEENKENVSFLSKWGGYGQGENQFYFPLGIAINKVNNQVYVADTFNNRIQVSDIEGNYKRQWGVYGHDPGQFDNPMGITLDANGQVYVVDTDNHRVQIFSPDGAWLDQLGGYGMGPGEFDHPLGMAHGDHGYIYVTDSGSERIQVFSSDGAYLSQWGAYGEAPGQFNLPIGVATNAEGQIFVADSLNNRVQVFNDSSGAFSHEWGIAGNGEGEFNLPIGLAVKLETEGEGETEAAYQVYVADAGNNRIQVFDQNGVFLFGWGVAGAEAGSFDWPLGIAIDSNGHVYVSDSGNSRIQVFSAGGNFLREWGVSGTGDGEFNFPIGLATDAQDRVYVADYYNNRIQAFDSAGNFLIQWNGAELGGGAFNLPMDVGVDNNGKVYALDSGNNRIQVFLLKFGDETEPVISYMRSLGRQGHGSGEFDLPIGITLDADGLMYVADSGNHRIQVFGPEWVYFECQWSAIGNRSGEFYYPYGIAMDSEKNVYVTDSGNDRVQVFDSDGRFLRQWNQWNADTEAMDQFYSPRGIDIDSSSNRLYVTDPHNDRVLIFEPDGTYVAQFGSEGDGSGDGKLNFPEGVAVGSDGYVYVVDTDNHRIQIFSTDGGYVNQFGSYGSGDGEFIHPLDIAIEGNDDSKRIYVADSGNDRIQVFDANFTFLRKWGTGGDGPCCSFDWPTGIAINNGSVYVTDQLNHRIQVFPREAISCELPDETSEEPLYDCCGLQWGQFGIMPGQFKIPTGIVASGDGQIYICDAANHRIQKFTVDPEPLGSKAIVVAGTGPIKAGMAWDAYEMSAQQAYRTLLFQGYAKADIQFLSAGDIEQDIDGNGAADDIDGAATVANLNDAINVWAAGANQLFIYLVGMGKVGIYQVGAEAYEQLAANQLGLSLNIFQENNSESKVVLVYDADYSGSFIEPLAPPAEKKRAVIAGSAEDQRAFFNCRGIGSFSMHFWTAVFQGKNFADSIDQASKIIEIGNTDDIAFQTIQVDANGNGIANESEDFELLDEFQISNEVPTTADAPVIGLVSPPQAVPKDVNSALIQVDEVDDADGILRVWGVVFGPAPIAQKDDFEPVLDMPVIEMSMVVPGKYEGVYDGFDTLGEYRVAVFAMDNSPMRMIAMPKVTTLTKVDYSVDIKVNDEDGPVNIKDIDTAKFSVGMDAGTAAGQLADWWLVTYGPDETWQYFDLDAMAYVPGFKSTLQAGLVSFGDIELFSLTDLSVGTHLFFFAVDTEPDAQLSIGTLIYDMVTVTVDAEDEEL